MMYLTLKQLMKEEKFYFWFDKNTGSETHRLVSLTTELITNMGIDVTKDDKSTENR